MVFDEVFDVIVGAGHAGCEAASAAARLGANGARYSEPPSDRPDVLQSRNWGDREGHIVREIDAGRDHGPRH